MTPRAGVPYIFTPPRSGVGRYIQALGRNLIIFILIIIIIILISIIIIIIIILIIIIIFIFIFILTPVGP